MLIVVTQGLISLFFRTSGALARPRIFEHLELVTGTVRFSLGSHEVHDPVTVDDLASTGIHAGGISTFRFSQMNSSLAVDLDQVGILDSQPKLFSNFVPTS